MKTFLLSALFATVTGTASLLAITADPTPTPGPTLPATEPEHKDKARADKEDAKKDKAEKADKKDKEKDEDEDDDDDKPAAAKPDADPKRAADEKAVRKLEQDWCDATANHDADFIAKVEVEDYTFTDSDGKLSGKPDELSEARQGGDKIGYKLSDVKVRIYGDTAILNGVTTFDKTDADSPEVSFRWTDTFVRKNGEWKVAASQATTIPAEKATEKEDE